MFFFIYVGVHIYTSLALQVIAHKTGTQHSILSWLPVLHVLIMPVLIARKPLWWILLMLVPGVNLVFGVIAWMKIADMLDKPAWTAFILLIPIANMATLGMYAWTD